MGACDASLSESRSTRATRSASTRATPFTLLLLLALNVRRAGCYASSRSPATNAAAFDRVRLGSLAVSPIGVGTIKWVPNKSAESDARLRDTFNAASAAGLNLYDSAERYGVSSLDMVRLASRALGMNSGEFSGSGEAMLGRFAKALADGDDERATPLIASKFTPLPWRTSPQSVVDACRASCARLGVDSIDCYQLHFASPKSWRVADEVYWEGLARCHQLGLAKNVGVSNYGPTLLERCARFLGARGVALASNQINYSLLYRKQGSQATVDYCAANGITVLAYYPLAMGLLADRWSSENAPPDRGLRRYYGGGPGGAGVEPLCRALREVAAARQVSVAAIALNWLITKGGDTNSVVPIIGATRPEHLADALDALGWRLSGAELAALEAASDALGFEFEGSGFKTSSSKFVGYGFEPWRLD